MLTQEYIGIDLCTNTGKFQLTAAAGTEHKDWIKFLHDVIRALGNDGNQVLHELAKRIAKEVIAQEYKDFGAFI